MLRSARWRDRLRGGLLAFLGVAAIGLAAFFAWHEPRVRPVQLRMTAGQQEGTRHRIAQELRPGGVASGHLHRSAGDDRLGGRPRALEAGQVDVAWSRAAWR